MIPGEEWNSLKQKVHKVLDYLEQLKLELAKKSEAPQKKGYPTYLTAREFMDAVHIKRRKFNDLMKTNKIKTIRKARKIYVPIGEVERFFMDSSVR